ncbi:hypothetical protein KCP73_17720 [Salmonella enterica subsp. enterica]|nr:hypothetical protein KCP73_17720 [Salmonella enterica subsp. enterica]
MPRQPAVRGENSGFASHQGWRLRPCPQWPCIGTPSLILFRQRRRLPLTLHSAKSRQSSSARDYPWRSVAAVVPLPVVNTTFIFSRQPVHNPQDRYERYGHC